MKVDCTSETAKSLCKEQEISGYPTMYLYKNGEKIVEFEGERTLSGLEDFVKLYVAPRILRRVLPLNCC